MESIQPIIATDTTDLTINFTDQKQGITPLQLGSITVYIDIGTTSSLILEPLYTSKYTIDFNGRIIVNGMNLFLYTYNDANAISVLQISGDGGTTFHDVTDEIPNGIDIGTVGPGLWINSIQVGNDGLQFRVLGKSTDGNPAVIRMFQASLMQMVLIKNLV